jgi:hypothetical protein
MEMVKPNLPKGLCVLCKGSRNLCGKDICPIILKQQALIPMKKIDFTSMTDLFGSSPPSFFVGHYNYPDVLVGPMIPPLIGKGEDIQILDRPDRWYGKPIEELVGYRTRLIRSALRVHVKKFEDNRMLELSQELAMAERPVDAEVHFEKVPKFRIIYDSHSPPMGPLGHIEKLEIAENPKVNLFVEKTVSDTDFRANSGLNYLYSQGLPVTDIIRVLSAGVLGLKKNRKLVPTRWAITAADDAISKKIIIKIKDFPEVDKYQLYSAKYLDNSFQILLLPREWAFEQLETWSGKSAFNPHPEPVITADHEFYSGRTTYASHVTGAYYSARLAVVEHLTRIRRQAAAISFREVSSGYIVPLGVWVIRETVRDAFRRPPLIFETLGAALNEIAGHFQTPLQNWIQTSAILDNTMKQRTLLDYIQFKGKREKIK